MRLIGTAMQAGLGEPQQAPSQFHFPGPSEFSLGLAGGLHSLYTGDRSSLLEMDPPVQASAAALKGAIESTVGGSIGGIVAQGLPKNMASQVYELAGALVDAAVDLAVEAVTKAAAELVGEAIDVIPVLGGIVSGLFGFLSSRIIAHGAIGEKLELCVQQKLATYCQGLPGAFGVLSTSKDGPTPADQFRQSAYAYHLGGRLPLNVSAMYVLLCGAESDGFGFGSKHQYDSWLQSRSSLRPTGFESLGRYGIDPSIQRKMWSLIKGIMGAVQDPALGALPSETDQGRTLMPILQEMVRQQWLRGRIPEPYLYALSDFAAKHYTKSCTRDAEWGEAGGSATRRGTCADPRRIDLVTPLYGSLRSWENQLEGTYYKNGKWTLTPAGMFLRAAMARGELRMQASSTEQIVKDVEKATGKQDPPFSPLQGLALGTGMVGMGYGAWTLMRRFGPKR